MLHIIAWAVIVLVSIGILAQPALFGGSRGKYGYDTWVSAIVSACLTIPLALRVLGYI